MNKGLIFGIIILSVYGGLNYYIAKRMYQWLNLLFPHINAKVYAILYIFFAFSMIIRFLPLPSGIKTFINWTGSYWMGIFVYLLLFFFITDMAVLLARAVKIIPSPVPQNIRFFSGLTAILFTVGFVCYGLFNANQVKNVSYDIQTKNNSLDGEMKIVLLSDLHFGAVNSGRNLENIVHVINDLKPDIVCIAGDIFDNNYYAIQNPSKTIELLKNITANYGVFACLGNHDAGSTFPEMARFIEQSNIKLLKDEYTVINDRLVLIGRLDRSPIGGITGLHRKNIRDILTSIDTEDTELPVVVMDHNPSSIGQYGKEVDLILSGHTHKGQIFPANLITKKLFTVDYGHYQKDSDSPHVVVSSGVGTWGMPMRVGTHSEIVSITLR